MSDPTPTTDPIVDVHDLRNVHRLRCDGRRQQGLGARNTLWRRVRDNKFPPPDTKQGNRLAWKRETIIEHLEKERLM